MQRFGSGRLLAGRRIVLVLVFLGMLVAAFVMDASARAAERQAALAPTNIVATTVGQVKKRSASPEATSLRRAAKLLRHGRSAPPDDGSRFAKAARSWLVFTIDSA